MAGLPRTQAELIAALERAGAERVIDVRAVPLSRRQGRAEKRIQSCRILL